MERGLPIFPCNEAKQPLVARGFKSARLNVKHDGWPLIGFPTGEASGIDVLDIDPRGRAWFDANFDALPQTRAHQTQRGLHLLFKHAPGLRCSTDKISAGIDVRATGGYAIWWPREGLAVEDHPICEWPGWLLKEAMGASRPKENLSRFKLATSGITPRPGLRDALFALDPICWRNTDGSAQSYDRWFQLMMAVKAAGISVDDWVEWCTGDPVYARHDREIARLWHCAPARHYGALMAALKQAGIKVSHTPDGRFKPTEVPSKPSASSSSRDWRSRFDGIRDWLHRHPTEQNLFNTACFVAEIAPRTDKVRGLLLQDCAANGLTSLLGVDGCRKTIERGFARVEAREFESESATQTEE
jgi:hypothetical protein